MKQPLIKVWHVIASMLKIFKTDLQFKPTATFQNDLSRYILFAFLFLWPGFENFPPIPFVKNFTS